MALFSIRSREIRPDRVVVLFFVVSVLVVASLLLFGWLNRPPSCRLCSGMTSQEVCAIMGVPDDTMRTQKGERWWYRAVEVIELEFRDDRLCDAYKGKGFRLPDGPEQDAFDGSSPR
jgi:hypothetical protein